MKQAVVWLASAAIVVAAILWGHGVGEGQLPASACMDQNATLLQQECGFTYVSKPGDTCCALVWALNVSDDALLALNPGLACNQELRANTTVCLPAPPPPLRPSGSGGGGHASSGSGDDSHTTPSDPPSEDTSPCVKKYTVQKGDDCSSIWANANLSVVLFAKMNPYLNCASLSPGDTVCIDDGKDHTPPPAPVYTCINYTTILGDTCDNVAKLYNMPIDILQHLNDGLDCTQPTINTGTHLCAAVVNKALLPPYGWVCNKTVSVNAGDTCYSIATAANMSLPQLQTYNLGVDCDQLWVGAPVCVSYGPPPPCTRNYTVQSGDYCFKIATKFGLSLHNFLAMNPGLVCDDSSPTVGQVLCVCNSNPPPCKRKYTVASGDSCYAIAHKFGMELTALFQLNPGLMCDETSPNPGDVVCVEAAQQDFEPTPRQLVTAHLQQESVHAPQVKGMSKPPKCTRWYEATSHDTCFAIRAWFGLSREEFAALNPGTTCPLPAPSAKVCIAGPHVQVPTAGSAYDDATGPLPHCPAPLVTVAVEAATCRDLANAHAMTTKRLEQLNPGLQCAEAGSNKVPGLSHVCVEQFKCAHGTIHVVQPGDSCTMLAASAIQNGSTPEVFTALNPHLNCSSQLPAGWPVCIPHAAREDMESLAMLATALAPLIQAEDPGLWQLHTAYLATETYDPATEQVLIDGLMQHMASPKGALQIEQYEKTSPDFAALHVNMARKRQAECDWLGGLVFPMHLKGCMCNPAVPYLPCAARVQLFLDEAHTRHISNASAPLVAQASQGRAPFIATEPPQTNDTSNAVMVDASNGPMCAFGFLDTEGKTYWANIAALTAQGCLKYQCCVPADVGLLVCGTASTCMPTYRFFGELTMGCSSDRVCSVTNKTNHALVDTATVALDMYICLDVPADIRNWMSFLGIPLCWDLFSVQYYCARRQMVFSANTPQIVVLPVFSLALEKQLADPSPKFCRMDDFRCQDWCKMKGGQTAGAWKVTMRLLFKSWTIAEGHLNDIPTACYNDNAAARIPAETAPAAAATEQDGSPPGQGAAAAAAAQAFVPAAANCTAANQTTELLTTNSSPRVVAYYPSWYMYENGGVPPGINDASISMISHINYAFSTISYHPATDTYYVDFTDPWADVGACMNADRQACETNYACLDVPVNCPNGMVSHVPSFSTGSHCHDRVGTGCYNPGGAPPPDNRKYPCYTNLGMGYYWPLDPATEPPPRHLSACGQFGYLLKELGMSTKGDHLRILLSIGGWYDSPHFSAATATKESRAKLIKSVVDFITTFGFDGVDFDWEFPGHEHAGQPVYPHKSSGSPDTMRDCSAQACEYDRSSDGARFVALLTELREAFKDTKTFRGENIIISAALGAGFNLLSHVDIAATCAAVDMVNIMAYDLHGPWDRLTNHQAPIYAHTPGISGRQFSIDDAVTTLINGGCNPQKLNMGIPMYGRVFKGVGQQGFNHSKVCGAHPPGGDALPGLYMSHGGNLPTSEGMLDYRDIKAKYPNLKEYYDPASKASYAYDAAAGVFVTFDNAQAIADKTAYIKTKGLGGAMVWVLGGDDDQNTLLTAVSKGLNK